MSLAAATREAVRRRPFLHTALRAGVVNYTAAARSLADDVGDDTDAISTALNRFADELPDYQPETRDARVAMQSGLGESDDDPLLVVGDTGFAPDSGSLTAVIATGEVDTVALSHVLARLVTAEIEVVAAGAADSLAVVVERRDGATAVRAVEDALDSVPELG
ncbi:DUF7523 family protein [Haladaptatus sp. NG-SE-30]